MKPFICEGCRVIGTAEHRCHQADSIVPCQCKCVDACMSRGTHDRIYVRNVKGLGKIKMVQTGHYYWQQCYSGVRLRFHVDRESPAVNSQRIKPHA